MKKMTKGAIVTGLGVALLLGGGGTLAVWNADQTSTPGQIAAGDLALTAGEARWTNAQGKSVDINSYAVVPGDRLTFTQDLTVTLDGDLMEATLTTNERAQTVFGGEATVSAPTLTAADGTVLAGSTLTESGTVTATTTFTFPAATATNSSQGQSHDLGSVQYVLDQQAPAAAQN